MINRGFGAGLLLALLVLPGGMSAGVPHGRDGLVFFRGANLDFVLPETAPAAGQIITVLEATATPGEIEGVGFGVRADRELPNVGMKVSDLVGPGGAIIPAKDIDPRVVQVWKQKGLRGKRFVPIWLAEGLLKDDSINLLDPKYTEENLPSIPPDAPVRTDLKPGESKGLYLIVHVPAEAAAGDYAGTITVGNGTVGAAVMLVVHVLPYKLPGPGRTIGMYFNDLLGGRTSLSVYRARLAHMRSMGVEGLRLIGDRENLPAELKEIKAAGFTGPIMVWDSRAVAARNFSDTAAKYARELTAAGFEPYIYGVDEPNDTRPGATAKTPQAEMKIMQATKAVGGLTTTALTARTDQMMTSQGQVLDLPLYSIMSMPGHDMFAPGVQPPGAPAQPPKLHPRQGYYFGCWAENPRRNRLLMGYYLYNSGMDLAYGWTLYSFHTKNSPQIFNDFDLAGNKKRWMTVLPTAEGCAPTLQSEAFREGVDDLRYLNTFLTLARAREAAGVNVAATRRQVLEAVARYSSFGDAKPEDATASQYTNRQFEDTRALIIAATLKLLAP